MGRKNVVLSHIMIGSSAYPGDMSADILSEAVNVINLDQASIYISWAGATPVGEITVEAQNGDKAVWYTLDFNLLMPVSGNTGDMQLVFDQMPFTSIRLRYNRTSGTGTMTATISMKVTGA